MELAVRTTRARESDRECQRFSFNQPIVTMIEPLAFDRVRGDGLRRLVVIEVIAVVRFEPHAA
jgi:hypothetical protein